MKYESKEAQILDFATASANALYLENQVKFLKAEYNELIREYFRKSDIYIFNRKDVIDALVDPEFKLATSKAYREIQSAKKQLKNAKRRLQTRYLSLPAYFKALKSQEVAA